MASLKTTYFNRSAILLTITPTNYVVPTKIGYNMSTRFAVTVNVPRRRESSVRPCGAASWRARLGEAHSEAISDGR